jgi:hypothetical protein
MSTGPQQPDDSQPAADSGTFDFDDPLTLPSADDTDRGWGEPPPAADGRAADLARFLEEKPPHHL